MGVPAACLAAAIYVLKRTTDLWFCDSAIPGRAARLRMRLAVLRHGHPPALAAAAAPPVLELDVPPRPRHGRDGVAGVLSTTNLRQLFRRCSAAGVRVEWALESRIWGWRAPQRFRRGPGTVQGSGTARSRWRVVAGEIIARVWVTGRATVSSQGDEEARDLGTDGKARENEGALRRLIYVNGRAKAAKQLAGHKDPPRAAHVNADTEHPGRPSSPRRAAIQRSSITPATPRRARQWHG